MPGLSDWYKKFSSQSKRLTMAALLAVVAVAVYGASCGGWFSAGVTCDQAGAEGLLTAFFAALVANQATFKITKG